MMRAQDYRIYKLTCPNGKVYIGMTCQKRINDRFRSGKAYSRNKRFAAAISEFGWENIEQTILIDGLCKEEAYAKEIEEIEKHKSAEPEFGYNISFGGKSTTQGLHWTLSEEAIENHRKSAYWKGRKLPDDVIAKLSLARKGKTPVNRKRVTCVETGQEFCSVTEAAKHCGVCASAISNCLSGLSKKAAGYTWRCA